jgi:hypothetical protein
MTSEPTPTPDEIAAAIAAIDVAIADRWLIHNNRGVTKEDDHDAESDVKALVATAALIRRLATPVPFSPLAAILDTAPSTKALDRLRETLQAEVDRLTPFSPLAAVEASRVEASRHTPHPTRRVTAKVTCVLVDADGYEITLEDVNTDDYRNNWRFTVADAEHYPVGGLIGLTVPA